MNDKSEKRDIFGELVPTVETSQELVESLVAGLSNVTASIGGVSSGLPFLGLTRSGVWNYGAENVRVDARSEIAPDLRSLKHGYSSWDDGKLLGEHMVAASESLPPLSTMPETGAAWVQSIAVDMIFINGEDEGVRVTYKTNSQGGKRALTGLINSIKAQLRTDPRNPIPIIRLNSTSYTHKKYGEIYTPIFTIVRWTDGREDPDEGGQPKPRPQYGREEPAPAREPEPDDAGPGRRRRVVA